MFKVITVEKCVSSSQIYFYASYVFQEAGMSSEKIQYITIGTGTCEFTACIMCVSIPEGCMWQLCKYLEGRDRVSFLL